MHAPDAHDFIAMTTSHTTSSFSINGGVDAMDDFIFSHLDPAEWTEEQAEAYERLAESLESVCVQ